MCYIIFLFYREPRSINIDILLLHLNNKTDGVPAFGLINKVFIMDQGFLSFCHTTQDSPECKDALINSEQIG
jgi:hypothetical protein